MAESMIGAHRESVTELLRLDHRRLDVLLADAKRLLAAGDCAPAAALFSRFRAGLERHIAAEEEVLFPAFEAATGGAGSGPTRVMRAEHAELRRLMAEIAASLESGCAGRPATPLAALTALVYAHNGKEERILYPAADRVAHDAGALVERIDAFLAPEAPVGPAERRA